MKETQRKRISDEKYKTVPDVIGVIKSDPLKDLSKEDKGYLKAMAVGVTLDSFTFHLMDLAKSTILQTDRGGISFIVSELFNVCSEISEFAIVETCDYYKKNGNGFFPNNTAEFYQKAKVYDDGIKKDVELYT